MIQRLCTSLRPALLCGASALALSLFVGCGFGRVADPTTSLEGAGAATMGGILHGGPNPVVGATMTLYTTTSSGYGATANVVATATTDAGGNFLFTLPTASQACPTGEYAYVTASGGSTGSNTTNNAALLMVAIGACNTFYSATNNSGVWTNSYLGSSLWIDELTTTAAAYALSGFMTVTNGGVVNVGAPANNHGTPSVYSATNSTVNAAAGLAHAFANAAALVNPNTGQPNAYTHGGTSTATGGVIPDAEIFLLGNILQACVNSNGPTGSNTATSNDGSGCGKLFSFTTPPQSGAAVPTNTMQAILNLAKYPNPSVNTWNTGCTAAGSGTTTATTCLFNLSTAFTPYNGGLTSAPPDWAMAVVYATGYGANTTATGCTVAGTCPGLTYPYYVAMDYMDNAYVLNWDASTGSTPNVAKTWTNIVSVAYDGTPILSTVKDTTNLAIEMIGTDTNSHVFGANSGSSSTANNFQIYYTGSATPAQTVTYNNQYPKAVVADPFNNIYVASLTGNVNLRKLVAGGTASAPAYTLGTNPTTTGPSSGVFQIGIDSNLDIYEFQGGGSTAIMYMTANTNSSTATAGTYVGAGTTVAIPGSSSNAAGMAVIGGNNAYAVTASGVTPVTKSGSGSGSTLSAGTSTALPAVYNGTLYSRYAFADGANWIYSVDGANGSAASGVSVFDSVDTLALGTYKGCYVISKACGTTAGSAPVYSPRGMAIDSAGDIWVVSGASANLTEFIGAAAPTWPALSMAQTGKPQ